jgi:hypothetical protein
MSRSFALAGVAALLIGCIAEGPPPEVAPAPAPAPIARGGSAPVDAPSSVLVIAPRAIEPERTEALARPPIGVAACDHYIAAVDACPADAGVRRGGTRVLLDKDAASWREMARSSTEGRLAVTFACQAALDSLRQKPCR